MASLDTVWAFADVTMALMTLCNLLAIILMYRWVAILLQDYRRQLPLGDQVYHRSLIPSLKSVTMAWPE